MANLSLINFFNNFKNKWTTNIHQLPAKKKHLNCYHIRDLPTTLNDQKNHDQILIPTQSSDKSKMYFLRSMTLLVKLT